MAVQRKNVDLALTGALKINEMVAEVWRKSFEDVCSHCKVPLNTRECEAAHLAAVVELIALVMPERTHGPALPAFMVRVAQRLMHVYIQPEKELTDVSGMTLLLAALESCVEDAARKGDPSVEVIHVDEEGEPLTKH